MDVRVLRAVESSLTGNEKSQSVPGGVVALSRNKNPKNKKYFPTREF
jgi:hypothetical protein